ncbi:complement resistance protein TraT [Thalassotalea ponticola]|uniref:complement resistance protein TraT n=1 Tax=Thalassotalea ponticola TaxID=1523392 RepID=UPI0025B44232|nr:complement resistance protein TraT [Thalassotalea ponticola]MDN3653495.1 complement resistance protein TraT [Thalassotalea ponticola]
MSIYYIPRLFIASVLLYLAGCSALHTAVDKRDLQVQTQMSSTIVLEPVAEQQRTVFLQLRNTSDKQGIDYAPALANALTDKGYRIVDNPEAAHYWIQANVLQVGRTDLRTVDGRDDRGYGAAIEGAEIGSMFGDGDGQIAAIVVGGLIGVLTDAMVSDIVYVMITDLQIAEKVAPGTTVSEQNQATLKQGNSTTATQLSNETVDRKKYQTRITSTANQVNLSFAEAEQQLLQGLIQSMTGILY